MNNGSRERVRAPFFIPNFNSDAHFCVNKYVHPYVEYIMINQLKISEQKRSVLQNTP